MDLKDRDLNIYIRELSSPEDDLLKELDRKTNLCSTQPRMLSGHIQGKILQMLIKMLDPKRILEIGTFTGYSAICMAQAMSEKSLLYTIDINDELSYIAEEFFIRSGLSDKIDYRIGNALKIAPELNKTFDLVYMDGDKREYPQYYRMLMDNNLLHSNSFILADNILWDGKVTDNSPKTLKDTYTAGIKEFNETVRNDSRVEVVILPIRDGMSIIRVK